MRSVSCDRCGAECTADFQTIENRLTSLIRSEDRDGKKCYWELCRACYAAFERLMAGESVDS